MKIKDWIPLESTNDEFSINSKVWNREIGFDRSAFPSTIKIFGKEILAAPISLNAFFGDKKGQWTDQRVIKHEANEEKAVYTIAQVAENLIVNATVTIEFDGFTRIDFCLLPFKGESSELNGLYIDIPVKNEYASFLHYWPNSGDQISTAMNVISAYSVPDGKTAFAHKPNFWTGWEYGGLSIVMPSAENIETKNNDEVIVVEKGEEYTTIRYNLLDGAHPLWQGQQDDWIDCMQPINYSIAFQPTPVKKMDRRNLIDWRTVHLYCGNFNPTRFSNIAKSSPIRAEENFELLEKVAKSGAKWFVIHEEWSEIQNYGLPENEEKFKKFVEDCHALGLKVMVYFGYEYSSLAPDFNKNADKFLCKNAKEHYIGGWQRNPAQRDYRVCFNGGYGEVMLERVKYVMDNYGVDGIYTDGTYSPAGCANEAHGCGYRDKNGNLHHTFPIYELREFVKKLYEIVHERGGLVDAHQSSCCCAPVLSFADSYFDGENILGFLEQDVKRMRTDCFRAEFLGQNFGIPCNFIAYTNGALTIRKIAGFSVVHNVLPRVCRPGDMEFVSKIWSLYDEYDIVNANWVPYWENTKFIPGKDSAVISYYEREDDYLLFICSQSEDTIELDTDCTQIIDCFDSGAECKIENDKAIIPVGYIDLKAVRLKK